MKKNILLISLLTLAIVSKLHAQTAVKNRKAVADTRPNVIVILADDLGYSDLHDYGNEQIRTPNLDALGKAGTRFTQAYSTAAICSPSRAGLLTGRYQQRFGFEFLAGAGKSAAALTPELLQQYQKLFVKMQALGQQIDTAKVDPDDYKDRPSGLPQTEVSLATLLKQNGYKTGITGKWHLGDQEGNPLQHGFNYQYGFLGGSGLYAPENSPGIVDYHLPWCFSDAPGWARNELLGSSIKRNNVIIDEKEYLTTRIGDEAVQFISESKSSPFFLYVPFNAPHDPFQALQSDFNSYANIQDTTKRVYYSMITAMDREVGRIVEQLKKQNIDKNTIIFFTSDNGGATYTRATDNHPLKGGKLSNFEGGFRVPYYVVYPGKVPAGKVYTKPASTLDIFATVAAVTQSILPANTEYDGVNLISFLNDSKSTAPHEVLFWRNGFNKAVRKGDFKLYVNERSKQSFLYNLKDDISEKKDLSAQFPDKIKELRTDLKVWEAKTIKPNWASRFNYLLDVDGEKYPFPL